MKLARAESIFALILVFQTVNGQVRNAGRVNGPGDLQEEENFWMSFINSQTSMPSGSPTFSVSPSNTPTLKASSSPSLTDSSSPTTAPVTSEPTGGPTVLVTLAPTNGTIIPTTEAPSGEPISGAPTGAPVSATGAPVTTAPTTGTATDSPTGAPVSSTDAPVTAAPTNSTSTGAPTSVVVTNSPTLAPVVSESPTLAPNTMAPTPSPTTSAPTSAPQPGTTNSPTLNPTLMPSDFPTTAGSTVPTVEGSQNPTSPPSPSPTTEPSSSPTPGPTRFPTPAPITAEPTNAPITPEPTSAPVPGITSAPTVVASENPTSAPTTVPTVSPTGSPSGTPTLVPTPAPTSAPTAVPTTEPTRTGSSSPTANPTMSPTRSPSHFPSPSPTQALSGAPTTAPTSAPTTAPTQNPTSNPTANPTSNPTANPTLIPTSSPTSGPTSLPTSAPTPAPTETLAPVIQLRLLPYVLQGGAEFEDPESYQSKALGRTESQVGIESMTDAKIVQYYALYCIYNATSKVPNIITDADPRFDGIVNFPEWTISTGWEETNLDPCAGWFGIDCAGTDQVVNIDLDANLLTGAFPPEVTLLAADGETSTGAGNLNRVDVFNNIFLFNNFDNSWMASLGSNLKFLYFGSTSFAGNLSPLPPSLVEFDCSFSLISGGLLDSTFAGLNQLEYVVLDGNGYNSTVPSIFGSLQSIQQLYIEDSFISGDLSYMEGMPSIIEHWIDVNPGLTGPVFPFIGNIPTLQSFSVTVNSLTGTLPAELGNFPDMVQMWYYGNELTGQIPTTLGNLRTMKLLQLEGNAFTGIMPAEVCNNVGFLQPLETLGADCADPNFVCSCCTCCSLAECNPGLVIAQ